MNTKKLVKKFIKHSPRFYDDLDLKNVDQKHTDILNEAYKQFDQNFSYISTGNYRDWSGQTDYGVPERLGIDNFKQYGILRTFFRFVYRKIFKYKSEKHLLSTLLDDVEVIKIIGAKDLLVSNPVHLTPGVKRFFPVEGTTVNMRWLRYVYLLNRILNLKILTNDSVWVDIGSFYGGLQGLVRKYNPQTRIVMVDFHHQLCRSFIYLSKMYPNSTHILPSQVSEYSDFASMPKGSFVYVPVSDYESIPNQSVDLFSNFFSFGEMKREYFDVYMSSELFYNSKNTYLVNRFVSAPFFEKTYDSDLSILDYTNLERTVKYFDIFPMHNYMLVKRNLFGRNEYRNASSSYFEMIASL